MLMSLEKQTRCIVISEHLARMKNTLPAHPRTGADTHSTARVLVTIVQLSFEAGDWSGKKQ